MNSCENFIDFDTAEDWDLIANVTRVAEVVKDEKIQPISEFDLGVLIDNSYVVVYVSVEDAPATWTFAGKIRQTWNFAGEAIEGTSANIASSTPTTLYLNQAESIYLQQNSLSNYRLKYLPPYWFPQVNIKVWKYIGVVENFTKDTLFDIGNKVGIGTLDEDNNLPNLIANLQGTLNEILDRVEALESSPSSPIDSVPLSDVQLDQIRTIQSETQTEITQEIANLSSNLSDVLSGESDPETLDSNAINFLEDEFI